jgi:hypothetical protein
MTGEPLEGASRERQRPEDGDLLRSLTLPAREQK